MNSRNFVSHYCYLTFTTNTTTTNGTHAKVVHWGGCSLVPIRGVKYVCYSCKIQIPAVDLLQSVYSQSSLLSIHPGLIFELIRHRNLATWPICIRFLEKNVSYCQYYSQNRHNCHQSKLFLTCTVTCFIYYVFLFYRYQQLRVKSNQFILISAFQANISTIKSLTKNILGACRIWKD